MRIKEIKHFDYEEKIAIIKEVKKSGNRLQIANKYDVGEQTIRGWEKEMAAGRLRKEKSIILPDLFDCEMKTDLIEFCEKIKDEVTDKFKSIVIIPFMMNKGYKEEDLINFFEVNEDKYERFKEEDLNQRIYQYIKKGDNNGVILNIVHLIYFLLAGREATIV